MKRYMHCALLYSVLAMAGGVFYREFSKLNAFTGKTTLSVEPTHYFLLGMEVFLLLLLQEKMIRTIVFITHDLDEAIKLGDRIAIMKDGVIVQVGTPEEILTDPANDYVTRFTESVDRGRIVTA